MKIGSILENQQIEKRIAARELEVETATRLGGPLAGAFMSMIGTLHNVRLWWWFEDLSEREARVDLLSSDLKWLAFVEKLKPLLVEQSSMLMMPRPISEMSPLFNG